MKATFALLASSEIHNQVRKLAWDIHQKYRTGIDVTRLPPHISLKQPFDVSGLGLLEEYMIELTRSIDPFDVQLTELQYVEDQSAGILWLDVRETETLRRIHNRVNQELAARFGNVQAAFDGPEYHFHMTVAIGSQSPETYRKIMEEFSDRLVNLQYTVRELAMFVYDEMHSLNAGYMTYMILPIGKTVSPVGSRGIGER
jgi:2'-5' RNA ligase